VETVACLCGAIANAIFSKVLKNVLQHERPSKSDDIGHGMPSSHAQSMFYFATYLSLAVLLPPAPVIPFTAADSAIRLDLAPGCPKDKQSLEQDLENVTTFWQMLPLLAKYEIDWTETVFASTYAKYCFVAFLLLWATLASAVRVRSKLHSVAQIVVGACVGSSFCALYVIFVMPYMRLLAQTYASNLPILHQLLLFTGGMFVAVIVLERRAQRMIVQWCRSSKMHQP